MSGYTVEGDNRIRFRMTPAQLEMINLRAPATASARAAAVSAILDSWFALVAHDGWRIASLFTMGEWEQIEALLRPPGASDAEVDGDVAGRYASLSVADRLIVLDALRVVDAENELSLGAALRGMQR